MIPTDEELDAQQERHDVETDTDEEFKLCVECGVILNAFETDDLLCSYCEDELDEENDSLDDGEDDE